jgi:ion channel-forming bestrophin family protein
MIQYNSKAWFSLIFQFHKSDTFRRLAPTIFIVAAYAWIVAYLEIDYLGIHVNSSIAMHSILGLVISLLLVFRTNTAYERWWEGRKLWGGLVNSSRNLGMKLNAILDVEADKEARAKMEELLSVYPQVLKNHLRNKLNAGVPDYLHQPNYIIQQMMDLVHSLLKSGKITGEQLLYMNVEITSFADICGACERIRKTPIPYSYSLFLKKFAFIYVMTFPFGFIKELGFMIIPATSFLFYVLVSLEIIAEEIEDPFGEDANDLPTDDIAANIAANIKEIFAYRDTSSN